jgi:lariat debranching enzyme
VGCTHGELDTIYSTIATIERARDIRVELLLCCGDFEVRIRTPSSPSPLAAVSQHAIVRQAVRNAFDLSCLAGPSKYHHYKDFFKYYNGEAVPPSTDATPTARDIYFLEFLSFLFL